MLRENISSIGLQKHHQYMKPRDRSAFYIGLYLSQAFVYIDTLRSHGALEFRCIVVARE
jgi:hypothetical protein